MKTAPASTFKVPHALIALETGVVTDGSITNASGTHPFKLAWPAPLLVRAKTGNATVNGERVSWVVGHVE